MKAFFTKLSFWLATFAAGAGSALAQAGSGFFDNTQGGSPPTVTTQSTLGAAITQLVNYALGILGLVAVVVLIVAGVKLVTSGGDEGKLEEAKKTITYAVIGLILIILSYTIVNFVIGALT